MTRPGYKMTEIGEIPEEWGVSKISDIYEVLTGTTPSTKIFKYWEGGDIDWLTPKDLRSLGTGLSIPRSERKITKDAVAESSLDIMPAGSILVSTRAPVGYVGIPTIECTFNQGCKGLLNKVNAIPLFHAYYLSNETEYLNALSSGSTFKELSKDALETILIVVPPNAEQQKIAEILTTTDRKIELIGKEIVATEKLKKGLMQTLLTRGIGHTRFKMTEVGEIPEMWGVKKLYEVVSVRKEQIAPERYEGDVYVGLEHMSPGASRVTTFGSPSEVKSNKWKFYKGDVLYGKLRPYLDKAAIADVDGICSTDILPIQSQELESKFLLYLLHTKKLIEYSTGGSKGTNHPRVNWETLGAFKIPFPQAEEQTRIAVILSTVDEKLTLLRMKLEELRSLKKRLMQDLLTGKVRVNISSSGVDN